MSTTSAWVHFFLGTIAALLAGFVIWQACASLRDVIRMLASKDDE